jgi:UDPglucose 6-dehydrogenase
VIIPKLIEQGASVSVYDPQGMNEAKKELVDNNIIWCNSTFEAVKESDIVVILTEWDEFKKLDVLEVKKLMKGKLIVDLRNILNAKQVLEAGLDYVCLGR